MATLSHLTVEDGCAHRLSLGYTDATTEIFLRGREFISLGCYCAVSQALTQLGLRQHAYPFDWNRSSMDGVIRCFENEFEDFLTYTHTFEEHNLTCFAGARWGGSFWHQNIEQDSVQQDVARRVDRLMGFEKVPPSNSRVFVRLLNSSQELHQALKLKDILQKCYPRADIYLLLIVDMQDLECCVSLDGEGDRLLVMFLTTASVYSNSDEAMGVEMQFRSVAYAKAIAFAIRTWAGGVAERAALHLYPSMAELAASCKQLNGGDPSCSLYVPRYYKGGRLKLKSSTAKSLPKMLHGRHGEYTIPDNTIAGSLLTVSCFGCDITFRMPQHEIAGGMMKLRLLEGVINATVVAGTKITEWNINMEVAGSAEKA